MLDRAERRNLANVPASRHCKQQPLGMRRLSGAALGLAAMLSLNACAVLHPEIAPEQDKVDAFDATGALPDAVRLADSLRAQYIDKVEDLILLDRSIGLLLIGAAAAAAGIGATGGPSTMVLGLGLGGVAGYTANSFINPRPQQFIYAAGAQAVQCALDVMQPQIVAYRDYPRLRLLLLGGKVDDKTPKEAELRPLAALIEDLRWRIGDNGDVQSETMIRGQSALERAEKTLAAGMNALRVMNGAGEQLRSSLRLIEGQVAQAIVASSPTVESLAASLSSSLPPLVQKFTASQAPATSKAATDAAAANAEKQTSAKHDTAIKELTDEIEGRLPEIDAIVSFVEASPSVERLATCRVDTKAAGLTMAVTPTSDVSVTAPAGTTPVIVTYQVSGGVLPYRANWNGTQPPAEEVEMAIESGQGIITVQVKKGAKPATYGILIKDAANGQQSVTLRIAEAGKSAGAGTAGAGVAGAGAAGAGADTAAAGAGAAAAARPTCFDEKTKKVQDFLLSQKVTDVLIAGASFPVTNEGCFGPVTRAAIYHFLVDVNGTAPAAIPTEQAPLLEMVIGMI
ncbi:hypothetical protein [Dongia sp.]|uniref:hypothetical protein n=1 Tax=Dongia sp. TaxID=1977262 RepID=UPI0035B43764